MSGTRHGGPSHGAATEPRPWSRAGDGLRLAVRVTPRARRSAIGEMTADADGRPLLGVRLAAPPVEGAANEELVRFLSASLGIRKNQIIIRSGATGRTKLLFLSGDPDLLTASLERLAAVSG